METITLNGRAFRVTAKSRAHRVIDKPLDGEPVEAGVLCLSVTPISTNNLFANGKRGRFRTVRYDTWRSSVTMELRRQPSWHVSGPVRIVIAVSDEARLDVDNAIKGILDCLVHVGRISDDRNVRDVRAYFDPTVSGTRIEIERAA